MTVKVPLVAKLSALVVAHSTFCDSSQVEIASIRYSPSRVGLFQEEHPQAAGPGLDPPTSGVRDSLRGRGPRKMYSCVRGCL